MLTPPGEVDASPQSHFPCNYARVASGVSHRRSHLFDPDFIRKSPLLLRFRKGIKATASSANGAPRAIPPSKPRSPATALFFTLTNENGDTSPGNLQGGNVMSAPGGNSLPARSLPTARRSIGPTARFWARCNNGGGGGGWHRPRIEGTWYRGGNRSQRCYIRRRGETYTLTNEANASCDRFMGFAPPAHHQLVWHRHYRHRHHGGNRINWDNGTFWTR